MKMAPNFSLLILSLFILSPTALSQPASTVCNGVLITYNYTGGNPIPPVEPANQAYRFESRLTVLNNGPVELRNWRVFVGFKHGELLVSASNAVLADGTALPANVSGGAVFSGSPVGDLKTAIGTAGNVDQMQAVVDLVGTQFGAPGVSLPENITLASDGYLCRNSTAQGTNMSVCCMPDSNSKTNLTFAEEPSPLQTGDVTIMYDVLMTYERNYFAQVTISNLDPFGRLENWKLSWEWMEEEFINTMRGAYPEVVDTNACIFGHRGQFYKDIDFSKALSCERRPTIVDLPRTKANDTNLGLIPFCCRNGTILPPSMDPTRSNSSFQMQVYKMPPDLNMTSLSPPRNWQINSTVGPGYVCAQPIRVRPTLFPEPSGLPSHTTAVATWQVVCNATRAAATAANKPSCCVSFTSFFNDSVVPCNTCACGCDLSSGNGNGVCSAAEPALLLPSEALLVPFDNRTRLAKEFADLNKRTLPNPLPCGDNCGVSINWHLFSDFRKGWTARITIFNWGEVDIADWYAAVELDRALPGFEKAYSMDGKVLPDPNNNTLFLQGLPDLNYLVAERNGSDPKKDPRVPGSQQTVISFTKKQTPGINVPLGDGFPTKVYFNGEECALPTILPSEARRRAIASFWFGGILSLLLMLILVEK